MSDPLPTASELRTQSPERLWGLSAESLYTSLAAKATGTAIEEALEPHIRAETIRTNDERDDETVVSIHDWLLHELGFLDNDTITLLGMGVVATSDPRSFVRAATVARLQPTEMVLRSCADIEENVPRRELDSLLADEWDENVLAPILASLGFMSIHPDSVEFDQDRIRRSLTAQASQPTDDASAVAYRQILSELLPSADDPCLEDLVQLLTGTIPAGEALGVGEVATLASAAPIVVDVDDLKEAVREQREAYEAEFETVRSLLVPGRDSTVTRVETDSPVAVTAPPEEVDQGNDDWEAGVTLLATVAAEPARSRFDMQFVTAQWPGVTSYSLYRTLSSVPGVTCEVSDGLVEFEEIPLAVEGTAINEAYTNHLVERCSTLRRRIEALAPELIELPPDPVATESMVVQDYESVDRGAIEPTYFTYTLVDPAALGDKKMDDFVGESRGLGRERARLRRWHERRSSGLESYTAMTDRMFSLGLERDLEDKVLRIMTPFDDDTFGEYVAQIRRLLEHGFELRLLTRHTKEPWEWRRLQQNLLSEIKDHRGRVTVRTYSRFKKHQRVTPDMDFRDLGEIGIHGKLQTVGAPGEGAALLGSANFMENSYDWNPECGIYTERTQFVDAAIEFFDIVWDISAADELAVERLQEIPDRRLVPTYYDHI